MWSREPSVANIVARIFGVLPAIDLDDQPPLAADEIDRVGTDRLLPDELVTEHRPGPEPLPERVLGIGRVSSQPSGSVCLDLFGFSHVETPPHPALRADLSPQAGRGYHTVAAR